MTIDEWGVGLALKKMYSKPMSEFKVVEVYFKEESGDLQKAINAETKQGWNFVTLSTYAKYVDSSSSFSGKNKAHAVLVFSKG